MIMMLGNQVPLFRILKQSARQRISLSHTAFDFCDPKGLVFVEEMRIRRPSSNSCYRIRCIIPFCGNGCDRKGHPFSISWYIAITKLCIQVFVYTITHSMLAYSCKELFFYSANPVIPVYNLSKPSFSVFKRFDFGTVNCSVFSPCAGKYTVELRQSTFSYGNIQLYSLPIENAIRFLVPFVMCSRYLEMFRSSTTIPSKEYKQVMKLVVNIPIVIFLLVHASYAKCLHVSNELN